MTLVPVETGDGSRTLFDTSQNIYYRSLQGAYGEAGYVFLQGSALARWPEPCVLELGLGTAMNFLATADFCLSQGVPLLYHAVEAAPLSPELFGALQHGRLLRHPELVEVVAEALRQAQTAACVSVSYAGGELIVWKGDWQEIALPAELRVHAIYHDPFGPADNPPCWTPACFRWSAAQLHSEGRLVTYAAATPVRRAMVAAGLKVASLPGSGTKREMTVAAWSETALQETRPLKQERYQ